MNHHLLAGLLAGLLGSVSSAALAADAAQVPEIKRTKLSLYYTAAEAAAAKKAQPDKVTLVDIRTRGEIQFVGLPASVDFVVPYADLSEMADWDDKKGAYKLDLNSDFTAALERRLAARKLGKNDELILICRSGDRSAKAADLLAAAGYTKVYSVVDGFEGDLAKDGPNAGKRAVNGWRNAGLDWSYQLDKARMYFPGK